MDGHYQKRHREYFLNEFPFFAGDCFLNFLIIISTMPWQVAGSQANAFDPNALV
jgi:hypothetical protein